MGTSSISFSRIQDLKYVYREIEPQVRQSFRIEAEHALRVVNDDNRKINDLTRETLITCFKESVSSVEQASKDISAAVAESSQAVENAIINGFHGQEKWAWRQHLDSIATQEILGDMLHCIVDKEDFLRVLENRRLKEAQERQRSIASQNYSYAFNLYKRALTDNDKGKAEAMNQEALTLFERAYTCQDYGIMAAFHLGELHQRFTGNIQAAEQYYKTSLGPKTYSDHYIRSAIYLSHLYYNMGRHKEAFDLLNEIALHFDRINSMCISLSKIQGVGWPKCQDKLEETLRDYQDILNVSGILSDILALFQNQRRFTATETFLNMLPTIQLTMASLIPDLWVYMECAKNARKIGRDIETKKWIQRQYSHLSTDAERRLFMLEIMSIQEFQNVLK